MTLAVSVSDGIATFTLDNPRQNRLSLDALSEFAAALRHVETGGVRVVVLNARGESFSLEADVTFWPQFTPAQMSEGVAQALSVLDTFEDLPVPVIAAVQGSCFGGAFEIALRADVIIAAESAGFRHPEATLGVFTLLGGVQRVAERSGRARAARWALTTEMISAADALAAGVVAEVVPDDQLELATLRWAQVFARGATRAHSAHKRLLTAWASGGLGAADELLTQLTAEVMHTEDAQLGVASAVEALSNGTERPDLEFAGR